MRQIQGLEVDSMLERAKTGDASAIEELLAHHDAALRASLVISSAWRSVLEVDDVLQVSYLEALLDLPKFEGDLADFGAWLRCIAQNNLRDAIKGLGRDKRPAPARRIGAPPGQDSVAWLWNFLTGSSVSPSGAAALEEFRAALEVRIDQLPASYADAIRLIHVQGRSIEAAASALGRSYGAVYLLHQRALDRLRQLLGPESQFFSR